MDNYILDGHTPVLVSWDEYLEFCKKQDDGKMGWRRVAWSGNDDVHVSTVFLTIDHAYNGGTPILFESMTFGGPNDGDQERYHTWDEAVAGHKAMCEKAGIAATDDGGAAK